MINDRARGIAKMFNRLLAFRLPNLVFHTWFGPGKPFGITITRYWHFNYQSLAYRLPAIGISITGTPISTFIHATQRLRKETLKVFKI
ncbi:MAG: hypothetical protein WC364_15360 [Eubacteriales bacterium]